MKKLLFMICALALSACTAVPVSTAPATYANMTVVDEQAAVTAHLAYKAFRLAVETGINAGAIKGATATRVAALDNQIYAALQTVDAAYATGNAADIASAVGAFNTTLTVGYTAVGGR